jgi:hypothetical protein
MKYERYASNAGSWLIDTARRNPEALLVLAAGCALMMRKGSSMTRSARSTWEDEDWDRPDWNRTSGNRRAGADSASASEAEGLFSGVTEQASEFVTRVAESVSDTASAASDYAYEGGRQLSKNVGRLGGRARSAADTVLQEQPIAVAVLGLAAGAALAAVLPRTEVENRALRPARDKLVGVAGTAAASAREKATDFATERLQEAARSAVDTFTDSFANAARGDESHGKSET